MSFTDNATSGERPDDAPPPPHERETAPSLDPKTAREISDNDDTPG